MAWVRLDEEFPDHPKVVTAGPLAGWLHVCALAYCNRHLTDGFVPNAQVARLVNFDGMLVEYNGDEGDARTAHEPTAHELATILVSVGMWEQRQGGYLLHDFLDYQPSRAEIQAQRKIKSDAGRQGGVRSGVTRRSRTEAEPKQNGTNNEAQSKQTGSRTEAPGLAKTKPDTDTVTKEHSSSIKHQRLSTAADDEDDSQGAKIHEATKRIAHRRMARTPATIGNPGAWLAKTGQAVEADLRRLLIEDPTLTVLELVARVDPDPKPAPTKPPDPMATTASAEHARQTAKPCDACGSRNGMRWNDETAAAEPCPTCNASAVGRVDFKVAT